MGYDFVCSHCARSIAAWDDGNPYYIDETGKKCYAYHPSADVERCTGTDVSMVCLKCGDECMSDSAAPSTQCQTCGSSELVRTWDLMECKCPYCSQGVFTVDPNTARIS